MMEPRTRRWAIPGGLRTQLLVALSVLFVVAFALVALVSLHTLRHQLVSQAHDHARLLVNLVAHDPDPQHVSTLADSGEFSWVGTITEAGVVGTGALSEAEARQAAERAAGRARSSVIARVGSHRHLVAVAPIGHPVGGQRQLAVVALPLEPLQERIDAMGRMVLIYLGLDALFILVVGYALLSYLVVRPVRAIGVATERAAKGDLASPISHLPPNEFGEVGRSFNEMLGELARNRRALEQRLAELDRANATLKRTQESLIRSEKLASVGQLAAGVAHEVGNPLAAISGYVELLLDDDLDPQTNRDLLERTQVQVGRIRETIRDLLDFSRDDAATAIEPVDLGGCVDEALNLVGAQPRARDVAFAVELTEALPPVEANAGQVVQVLVNLLLNAADAITAASDERPAGRVVLDATVDDDRVVLAVTDDGPGIDPEAASRIFDPFFTTKDPGAGTGLGLAISLRIMQQFGGDIRLESAPGEGARFELVFRSAAQPTAAAER